MLNEDRVLVSINKLSVETVTLLSQLSIAISDLYSLVKFESTTNPANGRQIISDNYESLPSDAVFNASISIVNILQHRIIENCATMRKLINSLPAVSLSSNDIQTIKDIIASIDSEE